MSGTINLAFSQQFDMDGVPLSGGRLEFFTAGTSTPQSAFQDTGLITAHPNPIVLDSSGRVPMFYLADGFIKIRLTDKNGVTVIAADQLLVIGPSTSTGGPGPSTPGDTTQLLSTGDIKARYSTGLLDGFVRCNGLTIGKVGSSATERADDACLPLYTYLWQFANIRFDDMNAAGVPAKGANALADWNNGRRAILPDLRGRALAGMDDMGATAAGRLTSTFFGAGAVNFSGNTNATTLGNAGGGESQTLTSAQLPAHAHPLGVAATIAGEAGHTHAFSGSTGGMSANSVHGHTVTAVPSVGNITGGGVGGIQTSGANVQTPIATTDVNTDHTHTFSGTSAAGSSHTHTIGGNTQNSTGGGGAHASVPPAMVLTFYMKM